MACQMSPPDVDGDICIYAAWRSIQAYTSRSLHLRCLPILYAGSPHALHLSRTVRSGTASIAATSRADSMRLEPPRVPVRGFARRLWAFASLSSLLPDGVSVGPSPPLDRGRRGRSSCVPG